MLTSNTTSFQVSHQEAERKWARHREAAHREERTSEKATCLCSFPDSAMCQTVLGLMVLCLLGAGFLEAEVTQTPGHLVKGTGQKAEMYCVPRKGHNYVCWYQQIPAKEFKFLISFQNNNELDKTGMPKERFSAVCYQNSSCTLKIQPAALQDSAVYLCASSESTVVSIS
ncbi:T cell receptor beta variable 16 [Camelus dromedarius]|nr:T cell receptor beta variable 16 [Camelus dromedarius]